MSDRSHTTEETMKALQHCITVTDHDCPHQFDCTGCPYKQDCEESGDPWKPLAQDALQLIIALMDAPVEKRVMDAEERFTLIEGVVATIADNGFRPSVFIDENGVSIDGWPMGEEDSDG